MLIWALGFLLILNPSFAEVGRVLKLLGGSDAYLVRGANKQYLNIQTNLEEKDEIFTGDTVVVLHIYPSTQISVGKNTQIKIEKIKIDVDEEADSSFSMLELIKGLVRIQVTKATDEKVEQKITANGVTFAVRGTEFEILMEDENVDLDVINGEVEVSSPYVHTFVPEIVKPNEGFRYSRSKKSFSRRKFKTRLDRTGFLNKEELRAKWKKGKERIRKKREELKAKREARRESQWERRQQRLKRQQKKGRRSDRKERRN